ncbi:MAG: O-antigen ligase family protein [Gemmatimonadaceae bacterium]|nr:O-antigen ligase family protein [Gemmatimonadaceae bacterium]
MTTSSMRSAMRRYGRTSPSGTPRGGVEVQRAQPGATAVPLTRDLPLQFSTAVLVVLGFALVVTRLHEFIPGIRLVRPVILLVLATAFSTSSAIRQERRSFLPLTAPAFRVLMMYWGWMVVSVPFSIYRAGSLQMVVDLLAVMLFTTTIMTQPVSVQHLRFVTRGYLIVATLFGAAILAFGDATFDYNGTVRYSLSGSLDENDSAAILAMAAPFALADARRKGNGVFRKLLSWSMLAVLFLSIFRTGSRGGSIALVAGLLVVALSNRGVRALAATFVLALSLLAVRQYAPPEVIGRFAAIGNEAEDYNMTDYGGRWQIWKRGIGYFTEDPVFGVGVGSFPVREGAHMRENGMRGRWSAAHNSYLQSLVELGLVGGLLFLGLVVAAIRSVWPVLRKPSVYTGHSHPEYTAAMVVFAVAAIFLSHAYFWGFFAMVGLCTYASRTLVTRPTA